MCSPWAAVSMRPACSLVHRPRMPFGRPLAALKTTTGTSGSCEAARLRRQCGQDASPGQRPGLTEARVEHDSGAAGTRLHPAQRAVLAPQFRASHPARHQFAQHPDDNVVHGLPFFLARGIPFRGDVVRLRSRRRLDERFQGTNEPPSAAWAFSRSPSQVIA